MLGASGQQQIPTSGAESTLAMADFEASYDRPCEVLSSLRECIDSDPSKVQNESFRTACLELLKKYLVCKDATICSAIIDLVDVVSKLPDQSVSQINKLRLKLVEIEAVEVLVDQGKNSYNIRKKRLPSEILDMANELTSNLLDGTVETPNVQKDKQELHHLCLDFVQFFIQHSNITAANKCLNVAELNGNTIRQRSVKFHYFASQGLFSLALEALQNLLEILRYKASAVTSASEQITENIATVKLQFLTTYIHQYEPTSDSIDALNSICAFYEYFMPELDSFPLIKIKADLLFAKFSVANYDLWVSNQGKSFFRSFDKIPSQLDASCKRIMALMPDGFEKINELTLKAPIGKFLTKIFGNAQTAEFTALKKILSFYVGIKDITRMYVLKVDPSRSFEVDAELSRLDHISDWLAEQEKLELVESRARAEQEVQGLLQPQNSPL